MRLNQRKTGVLLTYVGEAIKIISALVYTPVMLQLLGQSEYGLYQLVNSTVSYLSLLSLGFSAAYVRYFSRYQAENDRDGIARLNGMFMIVFCTMSAVCLICGGVMTANAGWIFDDGLTAQELPRAKVLMVFLVISMAITFPNSVFSCYVTAHEQFVFQKLLNVLQSLLNPFLTLPLLLLGYGSVAVVAVSTGLTVAVFISNIVFCRKRLKMKFLFRGLQFALLSELGTFTFFIFLNQIIDQINWSVDKFLLGRMAGTTAVAVYGVGGQINTLYMHMSSAISNVFVPKVNQIIAKSDDNQELTGLMIKVGRIQFVIIALVMMGFVFFGKTFIKLWAGEEYGDAYWVAILLMAPMCIPLIQNLGIEIQRAKNMHRARSVVYTCLALCNVILSIFLIQRWGCVGAAAGTCITLVICTGIFMNWYYHCRLGLDMVTFWREIAKFLPGVLIMCLFGTVYVAFVRVDDWIALCLSIVVFASVYAFAMWKCGLNNYEKNLISKALGKIIRKRT